MNVTKITEIKSITIELMPDGIKVYVPEAEIISDHRPVILEV